jgi:hypothetical protein
MTLDIAMRKQVALELGEEETTKDQRYVLLQKYGVVSPKIDRLVTKPSWMGEVEWKRKMNEWYKATKGLVTPTKFVGRRDFVPSTPSTPTGNPRPNHRSWREVKREMRFKDHQRDMRISRPNSGPTRTENRQSSQRNS